MPSLQLSMRPMVKKPSYSVPSRKGKVGLVCYVTPEVRNALRIHAIKQGSSIQEILEKAIEAIVAKAARKSEP